MSNSEVKLIEVRDRMTFIQAIAITITPETAEENYLYRSAGYGFDRYVLFGYLKASQLSYDPYKWNGSRTMFIAHTHLIENWSSIKSGDVVDVEFILGETDTKSISCKDEGY